MLETIREYINNLPDVPFEVMYQEYVKHAQDKVIAHDVNEASHILVSLEDTSTVLQGLNTLTEELKKL